MNKQMQMQLIDALAYYGDPDTYYAIGFFPDPPCGDFIEDFDETGKPGGKARAALKILAGEMMPNGNKFIIEQHGDAWALYYGRDDMNHGFNLCRLDDFDAKGPQTRHDIVMALNLLLASKHDAVPKTAKEKPNALQCIAEIIERVDQRCTDHEGPVGNTRQEMTDNEMREIYAIATGQTPKKKRKRKK